MKLVLLAGCLVWLMASLAQGQTRAVSVKATFAERLGPLAIDRMALGQGGLSEEPMWENRIAEVRALRPGMIRLFIQEYFDLLPERGRYQFATLDRSVETIRKAGAEPLMYICFKPGVLFPKIDHGVVEPNDCGTIGIRGMGPFDLTYAPDGWRGTVDGSRRTLVMSTPEKLTRPMLLLDGQLWASGIPDEPSPWRGRDEPQFGLAAGVESGKQELKVVEWQWPALPPVPARAALP